MKYPLDLPVVEKKHPKPYFECGRWYRCVESSTGSFTLGKAYLCYMVGPGFYLVDNNGIGRYAKGLDSRFEEIPE